MNLYRILIFIELSLLLLTGCRMQTVDSGLEKALSQAGSNREEIFRVIQHYQKSNDTLKLKAAFYLLSNMPDKCYPSGKVMDEYYTFMDSIYQIRREEYDIPAIYEEFQKAAVYLQERPTVNQDLQTLSAAYLIENIEEAFAVWNRSWNRHLSFEEFCEYILPYRIGTEIPETWRSLYRKRFEPLLQSDTIQTAKEACTAINNELIRLPIHIATTSILPIDLRPSTLANLKFGLCGDYAHLAVYAMRALGIPVGVASVPHWGRGNNGHLFNIVYDNDGTLHDFSGAEQNPDEHLIRFKNEIPKVYQETFGEQKNSLAMLHGKEDIPDFFKNPYLKDITGDYPFIKAKDIILPLLTTSNHKFAYLCVFDPRGWTPIAWGNIQEDKASFKAIGPNIVYHTALYKNGKLDLVGDPFLLDTLGHISYYTPKAETMDYAFERKNPKAKNLAYLPPLMIGCQFEGADNPSFIHPIIFHTITNEPDFKYITVSLKKNTKPVKYVRYQASDQTWGNMAEVEFYMVGSDIPLKGKVIGHYQPSIYYPRYGVEMLFDGDPLTFFHSQDTLSWGGLELKKPAVISKIRYLIRNDDNGIRKGHEYELFYMKNGSWHSLGKQIALKDDCIFYKHIPQGCLFWLRDYTKGEEERIFEIKKDSIIWL